MRLKPLIRPSNYIRLVRWIFASVGAHRYAKSRGIDGLRFHELGRRIGVKQLLRGGSRSAFQLLLNPLSLTRYFEFDFCLRKMPRAPKRVLDVSSPRLFPLLLALRHTDTAFVLLNPDPTDMAETRRQVELLGLENVDLRTEGIQALSAARNGVFDYVSSISVIEHIVGDFDDQRAFRTMLDILGPEGVLTVTVPLSPNKRHEEEFYSLGVNPYPEPTKSGIDKIDSFFNTCTAETRSNGVCSNRPRDSTLMSFGGAKRRGMSTTATGEAACTNGGGPAHVPGLFQEI